MLTEAIRYIKGYLRIRVSGFSPERFLNACCHRGIHLWGLHPVKGAYEMFLTISGFRRLKPVIKKTGTTVRITGRYGLPFFLHRYRRRKIFFVGACMSVCMIYFLSLFIWNIDIRGNYTRTDETLLRFLETRHVEHGMRIANVDCGRIVKDIRKEYDDIIWVSASVEGSRLIIQIKENEDSFENKADLEDENKQEEADGQDGINLVADQDCVITEMITRKGTPAVHVGDEVKKGDLLVSGIVEVKNDNQEVTGYQMQKADADIQGRTTIEYRDAWPLVYEEKEYQEPVKEELFVRIGSWLFWLGNKKNTFESSEALLKNHQLCIGEHFFLPIYYGNRVTKPYVSTEVPYEKEELRRILSERFMKECKELEKKGVEIIENNVKIYTEKEQAEARGTLTVLQKIGTEQKASIPEVQNREELTDGND